jgi:hypothetical protein
MNHSCEPTTISRQTTEQRQNNQYTTIALKDIGPGDEITCDYNLFEYDCAGKVIEQCLCGSIDCINRIAGFKYLSERQQKKRIQLVDHEVLLEMANDVENHFHYFPDLHCPIEKVKIVEDETAENHSAKNNIDDTEDEQEEEVELNYKLIATRSFRKGEVIVRNESFLFPGDEHIVIEVLGKRMWFDNLIHTVNKGHGLREFYYFDSFQNHSCDPNTYMVYISETVYDLIANQDIEEGKELTSDYETFDPGYDGTIFHCQCGSANCRKIIKG